MSEDNPYDLLSQARAMPEKSEARLLLAERAAKLFEAEGQLDGAFDAHDEACDAACWSGHPDKMILHTSWMLKKHDEHPDRFDEFILLWRYKWCVAELPGFPAIGRDKIEDMLDDCGRRMLGFDPAGEAIKKIRFWVARMLGDEPGAHDWAQQWRAAEQGIISDCAACEMDNEAEYWLWKGELERAEAAVGPVLDGRRACAEVPHRTYARFIVPLWRAGRTDQAADWDRTGYRLVHKHPKMVGSHAHHIVYRVITGDLDEAVARLERVAGLGLSYPQQMTRLCFLLATRAVLGALADAGRDEVALALPGALSEDGRVDVNAALAQVRNQIEELAEAFDARNQTRTIGDLARSDDPVGAVERFPMP